MTLRTPFLPRASLLLASALLSGCGQSCRNDKPYVPYSVDPSAAPSASAAELPAPASSGSADPLTNPPSQRFNAIKARKLKPGTTKTPAAGGVIQSPPGYSIDLLIEGDLDGDGAQDAAAWMPSDDRTTAQLGWFNVGKSAPAPLALASLPPTFAGAPGCSLEPDLSQIGPHSLLMVVKRSCTAEGRALHSTRWWSVAVPSRAPAERLSFTTVDQRASEHIDVQVDALDRDGDQFDDVLVTLSLAGSESAFDEDQPPAISVDLPFFDRPAGLSRDPHEPAASFRTMADKLAKQVKSKKARGTVGPSARRIRELFRSICGEWGALALEIGGAPLQCGAGDAMERIDRADVDAALQSGDSLRAIGLLARIAQEPGAQRGHVPDDFRASVTQSCDIVQADAYHLPFVPEPSAANASWGGLAFDASGTLLIRTSTSVMRFDAKTRVALPDGPNGPVAPWPLDVASPDGSLTLQSVYDPCDGGPLRATLRGSSTKDIALPLDPSPAHPCTRGAPPPLATWRAGVWSSSGLELAVDGIPLALSADATRVKAARLPAQPGHLGGARSADGSVFALATIEGVAVVPDLAKPQLWRVKGAPDAHLQFRDCVVAPHSSAVACVDGPRTRVLLPPP